MRLKGKLVAGAGAIMLTSAMGLSTAGAAAPPPVDVSTHHVSCDTVTGSIKFPNALYFAGSPGVTTNQPTVSVALDGCTDTTDSSVTISATKFKLVINTSAWTHDSTCKPDGTPTSPVGTGSSSCHATWAFGGKFDNADHPTDEAGNFGANGFGALAGASSATPSTVDVFWKCAGALKAKCIDSTFNVAGKPQSHVTIVNNYGTTATDPFGTSRGAFFVGSPLNGTHGIPAGTLSNETVTGAFAGTNSGHTSTFEGMLQQSSGMLTVALLGKGIKTLTFGVGDITSA